MLIITLTGTSETAALSRLRTARWAGLESAYRQAIEVSVRERPVQKRRGADLIDAPSSLGLVDLTAQRGKGAAAAVFAAAAQLLLFGTDDWSIANYEVARRRHTAVAFAVGSGRCRLGVNRSDAALGLVVRYHHSRATETHIAGCIRDLDHA